MTTYKIEIDSSGDEYIVKTDEYGKKYGIPIVHDNKDYQEYLEWLEEGNTPEPAGE